MPHGILFLVRQCRPPVQHEGEGNLKEIWQRQLICHLTNGHAIVHVQGITYNQHNLVQNRVTLKKMCQMTTLHNVLRVHNLFHLFLPIHGCSCHGQKLCHCLPAKLLQRQFHTAATTTILSLGIKMIPRTGQCVHCITAGCQGLGRDHQGQGVTTTRVVISATNPQRNVLELCFQKMLAIFFIVVFVVVVFCLILLTKNGGMKLFLIARRGHGTLSGISHIVV
mmetsp:Transcript_29375/g.53806  ORF Transcript_29375/g.53806 Transcript_29375/m.53806 type:complete len:223 (+) Transcript_29375:412-1080(+)